MVTPNDLVDKWTEGIFEHHSACSYVIKLDNEQDGLSELQIRCVK